VLGVFVTLVVASPADAATAAPSLSSVIGSLTDWLVGILAGLATLFLTLAGIRYLTAGGDPVQVERAKTALRSAMIGYALAALAPLLVSILQSERRVRQPRHRRSRPSARPQRRPCRQSVSA
jgi:hypothetical protein